MRASFKTVDITGSIGLRLSGYTERDHGNEGIHDPVEANIAVIESGEEYMVIVAIDAVGIDLPGCKDIRQKVSEQTPIKPQNILFSATHTHASYQAIRYGAEGFIIDMLHEPRMGETDAAYYELYKAKLVGAIVWAYESLEPVKAGYGRTTLEGLGSNRNDPQGYDDHSVNVLKFERTDGTLAGTLVNFGCHPTVLPWQNYLVSADYPGYTRRLVEEVFPGSTLVFLQGASGGASTRFTRQKNGYAEAERFGYMLGGETIKSVCQIACQDVEWPIQAALTDLVLKVRDFPSDEELLQGIEDVTNEKKRLEDTHADPKLIRKQYVTLQGATRNYRMKQFIDVPEWTTEVQIIRLGDFNFVTIPGEPFAEIGRDIKAHYGDNTFVCGYANDYVGYLVSNEGLHTEGYELFMTPFNEETHDRIVAAAIEAGHHLA